MRAYFMTTLFAVMASLGNSILSIDDLSFDQDMRLQSHVLLFHGNNDCASEFNYAELAQRQIYRIDDDALAQQYFPQDHSCAVVCLERGSHYDHVLHPLDYQSFVDHPNVHSAINENCQAAEIGFLSYLSSPAQVYWLDEDENRHIIGPLTPGEKHTLWVQSFLGHRFQIVDHNNDIAMDLVVEFNAIIPIGAYTSHVRPRQVKDIVRQTFEGEWDRSNRVQRTFTEFGFAKGRLPTDVFSSMSSFYYNNRHHATIEEWGGKGVFVNWWEKDVFFVAMPFQLKVSESDEQ
jgi:hypothetical protein